jgi:hypothetical protein
MTGQIQIWDKGGVLHDYVTGTSGRLDVSSRAATREYYRNRDDETLFTILSEYTCAANDYVIYVKNTSETDVVHIANLRMGAATNQQFYIHKVTGTPGGTTLTPRSRNYAETNTMTASCYGGEAVTGLTSSWKSESLRVSANSTTVWHNSGGIILNNGEALAIQAVNAGAIDITVLGYYE